MSGGVDVIATFGYHANRWRWRCSLCPGFGFAADEPAAVNDFERHYWVAPGHRPKEDE